MKITLDEILVGASISVLIADYRCRDQALQPRPICRRRQGIVKEGDCQDQESTLILCLRPSGTDYPRLIDTSHKQLDRPRNRAIKPPPARRIFLPSLDVNIQQLAISLHRKLKLKLQLATVDFVLDLSCHA
jgi:hypothetical protein